LQGCSIDLPLNDAGRRQATALAEFLSLQGPRRVYCSHLRRAVETATMIAQRSGVAVETIDGLQECNVGQWEGLDWGSIAARHPEAHRAFVADPARVPYLGGESYGDVLARARPTIGGILARHKGEAIAIVGHNVVNRVYIADVMGLDLRKARELEQSNCCVNVIEARDARTVLLTMNATFHLDGQMHPA
jgi:broad specificity phosphatase PhoE